MLAVLRGDCKDVDATNSVNPGSVCLYCDSLHKKTIEKKIQENPMQIKPVDQQDSEGTSSVVRTQSCTFICQDCYDKLSLDRYIAEKKTQENKMSEEIEKSEKSKSEDFKSSDKNATGTTTEEKNATTKDKTTVSIPPVTSPRAPEPSFTKTSPNDMYRKLLPAVLFVLTFVTVMTMLLIYMDTVALGAQQFRLNMSRDYELARIDQRSPALIQYVRQLHLAPRTQNTKTQPVVPEKTDRIYVIDRILGDDYNGSFVEFLPSGPRDPSTLYLELVRGWPGLVVRAAARDHLALRGALPALHACLSGGPHPREVTYQSSSSSPSWFSPRVLCLPLGTVLAVRDTLPTLALLGGPHAEKALRTLPDDLRVKVLEVFFTDAASRNRTTSYLKTINYTVAANFTDSVMYELID